MEEPQIVKDCLDRLQKYHKLMYQFANEHLDYRWDDVEDAVVDASLEFMRRCRNGGLEDRGIGAFILWQVREQCTYLNRKRAREMRRVRPLETGRPDAKVASPDERIPDPNPAHQPAAALDDSLLSEEMVFCLDALNPEQRRGILLDAEGFSDEEISKTMHAPLGTVKTRLSAARARLRTCLKKKGYRL